MSAVEVKARRLGRPSPATFTEYGTGAIVAIVATYLLFLVTPLDGKIGFCIVAIALFFASVFVLASRTGGKQYAFDRMFTILVSLCALITSAPLVMIVWSITSKGLPGLSLHFFTQTMQGVDPSSQSSLEGGALHSILGTISQVALASVVCVPFGIASALYVQELNGRFAPIVRLVVDGMSGIPSIVAGLFIYTIWVVGAGRGFSGFAGALSLAILMAPTVARTTEEMLRLVDPGLRESALALGATQWRTVLKVVLPSAKAGIVTAIILGVARVAGETAPLLLTSFGADSVVDPISSLHQPQSTLTLFIYQMLQQNPDRAYTGALVLILLVLILFIGARLIGRDRSKGKR